MTELFGMIPQRPAPGGGLGSGMRAVPFEATQAVGADGTAAVSAGVVPAGQVWVVERINVSSSSSAQSTLAMYDSADLATATFLDGSATGNLDVDDAAVLSLFEGNQLTLVWSGATPGATCKCRVQYRIEAAA